MDSGKTKSRSRTKPNSTMKHRKVIVSATPAINAAVNARRTISVIRNAMINARRIARATKSSSSSSKKLSAKKATPDNDATCHRRIRGKIIPIIDLLSRAATGYKSNIKPLKPAELQSRVETMETGPYYVIVTVPPATHTILVNITPDKIMISDWNGDIQTAGLKTVNYKKNRPYTNRHYEKRWEQYSEFIQLLQKEKHYIPVQYYKIDDELKTKAEAKAAAGGGGGCAEYAYEWAEKYKHLLEG